MDHDFPLPLPDDDIDRRGFLKCMAWAGTGLLLTVNGGIVRSFDLSGIRRSAEAAGEARAALADASFSFVQISDSHIGFSKDANKDVVGTLQAAVDKVNSAGAKPDLLIHTGDLSHLSKDDEFDTLDQVLGSAQVGGRFFVPGEHDVLVENGRNYRDRYGKGSAGDGWYSFDHRGVHFIALVNVLNLKAGGLGQLGDEQLKWLEADVKGLRASTPIVVFAHVPLWEVYPDWGWGTEDAARALALVKRFGSVTVLNGHIHQTLQKLEGNVTFHTAMSTAFPQPKPGQGKGPGPMVVDPGQLRSLLGVTRVGYLEHRSRLAVVDSTLASGNTAVGIANFAFSPATVRVPRGTIVVWTNVDDMPHTVVENSGRLKSPVLDTDQKFEFQFNEAGTFPYFCSIHPKIQGKVVVS